MRDIRYAFRLLTRKPGFAALALTTLVLGIGASTAMFTVLDQVVLRPLPYGAPEELVFVNETSMDGTQTYSVLDPELLRLAREDPHARIVVGLSSREFQLRER